MKKTLVLLAVMAFGASGAWAESGPIPTQLTDGSFGPAGSITPNSNTNEFEIYNAVNLLLGSSSTLTNNAQIDNLEVTGSTSTWANTGNGGYTVIGLGAGNVNSINVYNTNTPSTLVNPLGGFSGDSNFGNGTVASPYFGTGSVFSPGTQFGFAITSTSPSNTLTWYSDPNLNSDGYDHMLAYNLPSLAGTQITITDPNGTPGNEETITLNDPYLLAFEDTAVPGSDLDYNDMIVLVDGIAPVPEPVTVALFGLGLLAMAGFALRRKFVFVK